jgi:hypothetical protein
MANIRSTSQHSPRREDNLLPNEIDLCLTRAVVGDYEQAWGM